MLNDSYDWTLLGYHVSLVILAVAVVLLFASARRYIPSRGYRILLARAENWGAGTVNILIDASRSLASHGADAEASTSTETVEGYEDNLRRALGRSLEAAGLLRILQRVLSTLMWVGVTCAAFQGLSRLSIEKHSAPWAYDWIVSNVLSQVVWGLPVLFIADVLEGYCATILTNYQFHSDRVCRQKRL